MYIYFLNSHFASEKFKGKPFSTSIELYFLTAKKTIEFQSASLSSSVSVDYSAFH